MMSARRFLYKVLGIPDDLQNPTCARLLGLTEGDYDPKTVAAALRAQKKRLRGCVPGPQFLPVVFAFEKQVLEPAATALIDPDRRDTDSPTRKGLTKLVADARRTIFDALDENGTLNEAARPGLAQRLLSVGIPRCDVPVLLDRIPHPPTERIVLDEPHAPNTRGTAGLVQPCLHASETGHGWTRPAVPQFTRTHDEPAFTIEPVSQGDSTRWPLWIPVAMIAVFILFVRLVGVDADDRGPPVGPAPAAAAMEIVHEAIINDRNEQDHVPQEQPAEDTHDTPVMTISDSWRDQTRALRQRYSTTGRPDDLMADVALTMLAGCDRTERFVSGSSTWSAELARIAGRADRAAELADRVSVRTLAIAGSALRAEPVPVDALKAQLTGRDGGRYRAIETLRAANTAKATDTLLDGLHFYGRRGGSQGRAMASRILRALATVKDTRIPRKLIELIPRCQGFTAHQIVLALCEGTGVRPEDRSVGMLPVRHDIRRRAKCAAWWRERLNRGGLSWGQSAGTRIRRIAVTSLDAAAAPRPADVRTEKLIGAAAHYAGVMAETLQGRSGERHAVVFVGPRVDEELRARVATVTDRLARLAREHPNGATVAEQIDAIEAQRQARTSACETTLQKAAVDLDTTGMFLEIVIRETHSSNQLDRVLNEIRDQRNRAVATVENVMAEMREHAYHNLRLWDVLIACVRPAASGGNL